MPYAIGKGDIPGAVVVVVKDGQVLTERGYGYADVAKKRKVDPATTMFRPGSISKLFTWTALMQQVEQGKVDLNADVNKYIDFKIPPYEGKPITVLNLMTHTPGLRGAGQGPDHAQPDNYVQFDALLKRWVPKRIYAPGTTPAYSNYGASLAGYIVQRKSGEPFDAYVEQHIFAPLGMAHSTFSQPLPANLKPLMAEGYISGKDKPYGYEFVSAAPAGSLAASGDDMAQVHDRPPPERAVSTASSILQPATAQLMHSRANLPFQGLDGMAHGFYETNINGMRVIAHGGDTVAFHSDLHLFLDKNVGIFVSFNSAGKDGAAGPLRNAIFEQFADRYFPEPPNAVRSPIRPTPRRMPRSWPASTRRPAARAATSSPSSTSSARPRSRSTRTAIRSSPPRTGSMASRASGSTSGRCCGATPTVTKCSAPMSSTARRRGSASASWRRSSISTGRPGYRSSAWLLPLLYCSLGGPAADRPAVADAGDRAAPLQGARWRSRAGSCGSIARAGSRRSRSLRVLIGWVVLMQALFGDLASAASLRFAPVALQLLSLVVFVGGFAVMLWYA